MEDLGPLWSYQESMDELKLKLFYTTVELESLKMEANEEIRKNKEYVKNLLNLLKITTQERDEARAELQKLLSKLLPSSPIELPNIFPHVQTESRLVIPTKANSSITESNSLSDTYNHQSYGSSPVDSFFDAVSSPDFPNINVADSSNISFLNQPSVQKYNCSMSTDIASSPKNPASDVIDSLVKGKALPTKGKLLQAVMEAGPLLQTVIVAGPLPRWRNPPPLQPFKIPPVSIEVHETPMINFKSAPLNLSASPVMSRGSSQSCSASVLNFADDPSTSSLSNPRLLTSCSSFNNYVQAGKRQRVLHGIDPAPVPASEPGYLTTNAWEVPLIATVCCLIILFSYYRILKPLYCTNYGVISRNRVGRQIINEANPDDPSLQFHSHGLESSVLKSLPISRFEKSEEREETQKTTDCAVCLGEFEEGQWLKSIPNCTHAFHVPCIDTWFQTHSNCPMCRSQVHDLALRHEPESPFVSQHMELEIPRREEFFHESSAHYHILRSTILAN